ncbi:MAG: bifunctional glutamate N-acetyltransferase/amino-acid acetyltransferase ArgJ [Deltaproteobacteria bacterium]|nr:bifunctional glutamate N-acetyltransferase/amino-acid acetyltransferase ArgJ [Candidatus Zymogenaceae bacterium]
MSDAEHFVCPGFRAAGCACGIKKNGDADLALIAADEPATAAAVFTKNRVKAAPILVASERVEGGRTRAVLINSGNANACTGEGGLSAARKVTRAVADILGCVEELVVPASTGVIGALLPVDPVLSSLDGLNRALSPTGFVDAARAIMTTDTFPKLSRRSVLVGDREYSVLGFAKGAGMIRPDMATMLSFVVTDAPISKGMLQHALGDAVNGTFNTVTVDGDTSTNDMALALAGGRGDPLSGAGMDTWCEGLFGVLSELSGMIVKDGEGATKCVTVIVRGAPDTHTARHAAFAVAESPLVKTAFFGGDPNWGRIMGALGMVPGDFDPNRADISINDVPVAVDGLGAGAEAERAAAGIMAGPEFSVHIDLKSGNGSFSVMTTDLSCDYVRINADYRS